MADSYIPLTTGEKLQTFRNTIGGNQVDAEAVTLVSSAGAELFPTVASTFDHGRKSSIGVSAVQLTATSTPVKKGVAVKASRDNSSILYVGNSDVTADTADATDGFELFPGESITIGIDNVNKIYVISKAAGQEVFWLVV